VQDLAADLPKVLGIFALSWLAFWPAIPAGIALGLSPVVVIATTTMSYTSGVAAVLLVGGRLREWFMRRVNRGGAVNPDSRIQQIWKRYGIIGLGLASPMTVGAQAGAVIGVTLNVPARKLLLWMTLGALAWSIGLTTAVVLGVLGVRAVG
jgi:hypothetical protein